MLDDKTSFWRALTSATTFPDNVGAGVGNVKSGREDALLDSLEETLLVGVVEHETIAVVVLRATTVTVVLMHLVSHDWALEHLYVHREDCYCRGETAHTVSKSSQLMIRF